MPSACALALLLVTGQAAHAQYGGGGPYGPPTGSWSDPTTTYSGSFDYNYVYYGTTYTGPDSWAAHYSQFLWVSSDPGLPSHVTSQGTYTVKRTWSGSAPPPTKPVYILETSYAIGSGGIYGNTPGSGTAQDAFNDDPVPIVGGVVSSGGKLVQVDGSSGVISLSGTVSASGDTPAYDFSSVPGNTAVYSGVNSSFSWAIDSRALSLSRDGARSPGKVYSPDGQLHGEYVDESGVGHGETTYSYTDTESSGEYGISTLDYSNWQTFHPIFAGGWSTITYVPNGSFESVTDYDITWKWYPNESDDTLHNGLWKMPYGDVNIVDGDASGTADSPAPGYITYTATDNQNPATATATYDLTVHDQWDNKRGATPATTLNHNRYYAILNGAPVGVGNYTPQKYTSPATCTSTINASATLGVKFTAGFDASWAKTVGIEVNASGTVGGSVGITVPGPLLDPGQESFPFADLFWTTDNYLVDSYTTTGYVATCLESADDPASSTIVIGWTPEQKIGTPPPP